MQKVIEANDERYKGVKNLFVPNSGAYHNSS